MSLSHLPHRYTVLRYTVLQYMTSCSRSVGMLNIDCSAVGTTQQLWWWRKWHTIHASPRSLGRSPGQLSGMPVPACDINLLLLLLVLLSDLIKQGHDRRLIASIDMLAARAVINLLHGCLTSYLAARRAPGHPPPLLGASCPHRQGTASR